MSCYCLGNVREVVSEPGEVKQVNAYYPFDMPIHALDVNESPLTQKLPNSKTHLLKRSSTQKT